ncbi:MAG TPA: SET domain-containing protein-lysine N-methyltransferase [Candidatus Lokiarchaeia archaeon]|nr:SET domain-containing protein-lysine N-methyltransferase [Candidatus Lokiarchaeia archaeon]
MFAVKHISEKKGRGLVATRFIKARTIIDVAHALILSEDDYYIIQDTKLYGYIFEWENTKDNQRQYAIALSVSELINHSYNPNTKYKLNYTNQTITFVTIKDIHPGEEITMNYHGHPTKVAPVWFEVDQS